MTLGAQTTDVIQILDAEYSPISTDIVPSTSLPDVKYFRSSGELNGNAVLNMKYPVNGINSDKIAPNKVLMCKINRYQQTQPMRIISVKKTLTGADLEIKAEHLTNDLRNFVTWLTPSAFAGSSKVSASVVGSYYFNNAFPNHVQPGSRSDSTGDLRPFPFTFWADPSLTVSQPSTPNTYFQMNPRSTLLEFLGGTEESLLTVFGGEYLRDRHYIKLYPQIGSDKGFRVQYGMNMTDLDMTVDLSSTLYGVVGFISYQNELGSEIVRPSFLNGSGASDIDFVVKGSENSDLWNATGIEIIDMAPYADKSIIESQDSTKIDAECLKCTKEYVANNPSRFEPNINIKVDFVDLANKPVYSEFLELRDIELGDTVAVQHLDFGIDVKTRLIKYEYDFLTNEYTNLELGSPKNTFLKQLRNGYSELYYKAFNMQSVQM